LEEKELNVPVPAVGFITAFFRVLDFDDVFIASKQQS
jgi:hypothetical protein